MSASEKAYALFNAEKRKHLYGTWPELKSQEAFVQRWVKRNWNSLPQSTRNTYMTKALESKEGGKRKTRRSHKARKGTRRHKRR
jgi:hypothetical protein